MTESTLDTAGVADLPRDEGYIEVTGGRVWYERMGRPDAPPLLLLHGGPGRVRSTCGP